MLTIIMTIVAVASLCGVDVAHARAGDITEAPAFNTLLDSIVRDAALQCVPDHSRCPGFQSQQECCGCCHSMNCEACDERDEKYQDSANQAMRRDISSNDVVDAPEFTTLLDQLVEQAVQQEAA